MELDFAFLFVVNVMEQTSIQLISGGRELALVRPEGHVSPKAQFVPAFFKGIEDFEPMSESSHEDILRLLQNSGKDQH
jgi:hypothetical protein